MNNEQERNDPSKILQWSGGKKSMQILKYLERRGLWQIPMTGRGAHEGQTEMERSEQVGGEPRGEPRGKRNMKTTGIERKFKKE